MEKNKLSLLLVTTFRPLFRYFVGLRPLQVNFSGDMFRLSRVFSKLSFKALVVGVIFGCCMVFLLQEASSNRVVIVGNEFDILVEGKSAAYEKTQFNKLFTGRS